MNKQLNLLLISALILFCLINCGKDNADEVIPDAPDANDKTGWKLVFEENFDGSAVNTAEWSMYNGSGHTGNGLRRPEAFSIENGLLVVTAQMKDGQLVSGGMAHRKNYTYGKFEFRVRTEKDPALATSGVVLTWPQSEIWPADGELDIYETMTNGDRNPFYTVIHYAANNQQIQYQHHYDATQWHTIAMEWLPEIIRIFRDDVLVYTCNKPEAIPDVAHHLCIQLDAFKTTMNDPVHMYVDWVKIYQPDSK
ncbi:MAG: glycoside hydrolase family 16 protein [Dysgonamonadaceae bacterium]|jgi:beta-glucanase (GH16 family)|nr:glycoside hydrolase family 16 protein [Dysgonamonadaceae bacterium]